MPIMRGLLGIALLSAARVSWRPLTKAAFFLKILGK